MPPDSELLRRYHEDDSQQAFAEFVRRHLTLVYSAAFRLAAGDRHRAEDIAQQVFQLAAARAGRLQRHPEVGGWLYRTTCHTGAKLRRSEQRRLRREREYAAERMPTELASDATGAVDWDRLAPVLDELMWELRERDRLALLWRYFEGRSHGEIGERLGLNANAARMRQERALEALRGAMARRGLLSGAAALSTALGTYASVVPPTGLGATIATGAGMTAGATGLLVFMNTTVLKYTAVAAAIGVGSAGLIWQQTQLSQLRAENADLRGRLEAAALELAAKPAPAVPARVARVMAETQDLRAQIELLRQSPAASWQERAEVLRELVDSLPELKIPEMQLATDEDWLDATKEPMETEEDYRRALGQLRNVVIGRFVGDMSVAVRRYMAANGAQFPTDPAQLEPFLERSVGPEVWSRYEIALSSSIPMLKMGGDWIITQTGPIDAAYDSKFVVGPRGMGTTSYRAAIAAEVLGPVRKAYAAANPEGRPGSPEELLPFATTSEQRDTLLRQLAAKPMGAGP